MDADMLIERLLSDDAATKLLTEPLSDDVAGAIVERLKQEADRHWTINANRSLALAAMIIQIGHARADQNQIALGMMARGDALKLLGRNNEAWEALEQAGDLFAQEGNQVGWARTRIGRLLICVDLNKVAEALADAETARQIFTQNHELEKSLRLDLNTAFVYNHIGEQRRALMLFHAALSKADSLGETGQRYKGLLYNAIGYAYQFLGDFDQAIDYYERAMAVFVERQETSAVAVVELNIASIAQAQGKYRRALTLLHHAHDLKIAEQLYLDAAYVKRDMVECYLMLNRLVDARDLAEKVSAEFREFGAPYEEALSQLYLSTAEAELGQFAAAQSALDTARSIFTELGAAAKVATTQLRQGRVALQQGNFVRARDEALAAAQSFEEGGQQVDYATAKLLCGQATFALGDMHLAQQNAIVALKIAQRCNVPRLRYNAHLLLGRIAEARGNSRHAVRRYQAAAATVNRVQRGLTITLRPGFLEDKEEALHLLLGLHLHAGNTQRAFETLEQAKSQALLSYLADREQLQWATDDAEARTLNAELEHLRAEHQWLYRAAHGYDIDGTQINITPEQALVEVVRRERRMRAITERLYLIGGNSSAARHVTVPSVQHIKHELQENNLLIEYYNDGSQIWAFTLDHQTLELHRLSASIAEIDQLLAQFQINIAAALKAGPYAPSARSLTNFGQRLLRRLYDALLAPLAPRLQGYKQLVIVPYGALHYLPFHLLYSGAEYLIERYQIVILPAASLVTQRGPVRSGGARVLAHAWDDRLPQTKVEAARVQYIFGGELHSDHAASREVLQAEPTQILHIAAHGEHRPDNPDLSYIQLDDGQLYTDDLLQHDLSYELVILSACETGRIKVAAGDELIGLGRGFLYAGAGALIASLWRVVDNLVVEFMDVLYLALHCGASKAAALRSASLTIRDRHIHLHPAFWGAFQLIGDPRPLSANERLLGKDTADERYAAANAG